MFLRCLNRGGLRFVLAEVRNMASTTFGSSDRGYDMSLWYDSRIFKVSWFAMLAAVGCRGHVSARLWVLPRAGLDDAGVRNCLDGAVAL